MSRTFGLLIARAVANAFSFATFIVIGRGLSPVEFAIYAVASSIGMLFMAIAVGGLPEHVIARDPERKHESTTAWLAVMTGAGGCALSLIIALILGAAGQGDVGAVLAALAPLPILYGLTAVPEARLVRDNRGAAVAINLVLAEALGFAALLVTLAMGAGVFALAWSRILNHVSLIIGYFIVLRMPLPGRFEAAAAPPILRFSFGLLASKFVQWADNFGQDLLLWAVLPRAGLGEFRMASRLSASMVAITVGAPAPAQLLYVAEAHKRRPHRFAIAFERATTLHLLFLTPIFFGVASVAIVLTPLLLGPEWESTGILVMTACLLGPFFALGSIYAASMTALGQTRQLFFRLSALTVIILAALVGAAFLGPVAAMVGRVVAGAIGTIALLFMAPGLDGGARGRILMTLVRISAAGCALAIAAQLTLFALPAPANSVWAWAELALAGVAGLAAYAVFIRILAPRAWRQAAIPIKRILRRWARRSPEAPAAEAAGRP